MGHVATFVPIFQFLLAQSQQMCSERLADQGRSIHVLTLRCQIGSLQKLFIKDNWNGFQGGFRPSE